MMHLKQHIISLSSKITWVPCCQYVCCPHFLQDRWRTVSQRDVDALRQCQHRSASCRPWSAEYCDFVNCAHLKLLPPLFCNITRHSPEPNKWVLKMSNTSCVKQPCSSLYLASHYTQTHIYVHAHKNLVIYSTVESSSEQRIAIIVIILDLDITILHEALSWNFTMKSTLTWLLDITVHILQPHSWVVYTLHDHYQGSTPRLELIPPYSHYWLSWHETVLFLNSVSE